MKVQHGCLEGQGTAHEKCPQTESSTVLGGGFLRFSLFTFATFSVYTMRPSQLKDKVKHGAAVCWALELSGRATQHWRPQVPCSGQAQAPGVGAEQGVPPLAVLTANSTALPTSPPTLDAASAPSSCACLELVPVCGHGRSPCFPCCTPFVLLWFKGPVIISFLRGKNLCLEFGDGPARWTFFKWPFYKKH